MNNLSSTTLARGSRPRQPNRARALSAFANLVVAVPDPLESDAAAARFTHADLADLPLPALRREQGQLHLYHLLHATPHPWTRERRHMIAVELLARGEEP